MRRPGDLDLVTVRIERTRGWFQTLKRVLQLDGTCEGRGRCGTCGVVIEGSTAPPPSPADRRWIGAEAIARGVRLLCTLPPGTYRVRPFHEPGPVVAHPPDRIVATTLLPGPRGPGVAVDIGTTTVSAAAFDECGTPKGFWTTPNLQRRHGADVMSRVGASFNPPCGSAMREEVAKSMGAVVEAATSSIGPPAWLVAVGNTVMHHLAAGIDARPLGSHPYAPCAEGLRWREVRIPRATKGIPWSASLVPPLGGLVGSDVVASVALLRHREMREPWLLVDMGTNCEMALWEGGRLWFTSVPAGPAFEGGNLSWGCTARDGAVAHVDHENGGFRLAVIGGGEPLGLCGSAAIDLCALLRFQGLVEESGKMIGNREVRLSLSGIGLDQRDVREVQKAKAAVELGVRALLHAASLRVEDLCLVVLSGAFARALRLESAMALGLIPSLSPKRFLVAGNTALLGAGLCRDPTLVEDLRRRGRQVSVEGEGFLERFAGAVRLRPWA